MLVAELPSPGEELVIKSRPVPVPGQNEVLIKIDACGVCGSDLFLQKGGFPGIRYPVVPGHEAAGTVVDVGEGVNQELIGKQVALYYINYDPSSPYAVAGHPNIGPNIQRMGVDVDGAFSQYVVRPVHTVIPVEKHIEPASLAVLTDAFATPYHALVDIGQLKPSETVLILGIGGIGSAAIQIAKNHGATVVAASRSHSKLELATELGADYVYTIDQLSTAPIRNRYGDRGADMVIQCSSSASLDALAIEMVGLLGRVVFVGTSTDAYSSRASTLIWKEATVLGSRGFTPQNIQAIINSYLKGELKTDYLTKARFSLTDVNQALRALRDSSVVRAVILPNASS